MMESIKPNVWRLIVGGKKYLGLIPHDISYFNEHFNGKNIPSEWTLPPITIDGSSKKLPDFVSWMKKAPVVSERAKVALLPIVGDCVQFVPFHEIKGKKYYVMNVLRIEENILDTELSEIFFSSSEPKIVLSLDRACFTTPSAGDLSPVFKVSVKGQVLGDVFVTKRFADVLIENKLTGAALLNPNACPMELALSGASGNIVPGVPE